MVGGHDMTYGSKRRSLVENENLVGLLAHRKHGTVKKKALRNGD